MSPERQEHPEELHTAPLIYPTRQVPPSTLCGEGAVDSVMRRESGNADSPSGFSMPTVDLDEVDNLRILFQAK